MKYFPIMPSWLKIATWLLLVSIGTMFIKKPSIFFPVNINDIFLLLSFISFSIAVYKKELSISFSKKTLVLLGMGVGTLIVGSFISIAFFGVFTVGALIAYMRIISVLILFIEAYSITRNDPTFASKALFALAISSVFLPLMFYSPLSIRTFFLDNSLHRFAGFLVDPNYFASFELACSAILFWFAVKPSTSKNGLLPKFFYFILFAYSIGSILWSGSRGGFFGLIIMLVTIIGFLLWKLPLKKSIVFILILLVGCVAGYGVLPSSAKYSVALRIHNIQNPYYAPPGQDPFLVKISGQQNRIAIWKSAVHNIIRNPLGYGPSYHETATIQGDPAEPHRVAHNTILEILLTGGIGLIVTLTVALYWLFKGIYRDSWSDELFILIPILIGLFATGLLLDSLWSRWIWLVLALIAAISSRRKEFTKL